MNADHTMIKDKKRPAWKWIFIIVGDFFTLVGIYFLFTALINYLSPASTREPYSPVTLILISVLFLLVGVPLLLFGLKRQKSTG